MSKQAKNVQRQLHELEVALGHPVLQRPCGEKTPEVSELFVVIFGTQPEATSTSVLGLGTLVLPSLVLVDEVTVTALKRGASPTTVGLAWVAGSTPHAEARTVGNYGHRDAPDASGADLWAIELGTPSTAPQPGSGIPSGGLPASGFCIFFPWLTMCQRH